MSKKPITWILKPVKEWKIDKFGKRIPGDLVKEYEGRIIPNFDETGKVKLSYDEQYYKPAERTEIDWSDGLAPQETGPSNPKVKRDHYYQQLHNRSCKTREERAEDERKKKLKRLIAKRKITEAEIAATDNRIKKLKTPRQSPCQGCAIMGGRTRKRKSKIKRRRKSKIKRRRKSKRRKSKIKRRRKRRKTKKH